MFKNKAFLIPKHNYLMPTLCLGFILNKYLNKICDSVESKKIGALYR